MYHTSYYTANQVDLSNDGLDQLHTFYNIIIVAGNIFLSNCIQIWKKSQITKDRVKSMGRNAVAELFRAYIYILGIF